jgi:acylglycerol lipase
VQQGEGELTGATGATLFHRAWLPDGDPVGVVLIGHGLGEHCGRYANVAEALVPAGYAVWGMDHQGHGRSSGRRTHIRRYRDFVDDVDVVRRHVAGVHPGVPLFLLGHSMGGNIALGYALEHQEALRGLVLSAPALTVPADVPRLLVLVSGLLGRLAPRLRVAAVDAAKISRDPDVVAAYRGDPLVCSGKYTAGLGFALLGAMRSFPDRVGDLRLPLLILHGGADELADPAGSRMLEARVGSDDLTVRYYPGLYHEIFNEPEQNEVLADLRGWLDTHRG